MTPTSRKSALLPLLAALMLGYAHLPALAGEVRLEADLGQSVLSAKSPGKVYLRLSLKALAAQTKERRTPVNVALVLDRSGSMQGERMAAAKEAARVALDRLGSEDVVALVAYNHNVDVLARAQRLTSHDALKSKIDALKADGRTALYAGVVEGGREVKSYLAANKVNRVILLSDGLANVGPSTPKELGELGRDLARQGISVTTIGLGLDYNEDLMQRLASASDGNHAFAEKPSDLSRIFNAEFGDALSIAAQDIEIIIECKVGFKPTRVLGRTADIEGQRIKLKMNQLQAENERYVVVELDAPSAHAEGEAEIASVELNYLDLEKGAKGKGEAKVRARFSSSEREAEASVNKPVMAQVTEQVATEASEKAVELRDKGDVAGARKALEDNATFLGRAKSALGSGAAPAPSASVKSLDELEKKNREAASNLDADKWDKTRKSMRYDQHKSKVQQTY